MAALGEPRLNHRYFSRDIPFFSELFLCFITDLATSDLSPAIVLTPIVFSPYVFSPLFLSSLPTAISLKGGPCQQQTWKSILNMTSHLYLTSVYLFIHFVDLIFSS